VTGIILQDVVDLSFVEATPTLTWTTPSGATSGLSGDTITWSLPSIGPGATESILIESQIRTGGIGSFCSPIDGSWTESLTLEVGQSCAEVLSGCPTGGVAAVGGLAMARLGDDVFLSWPSVGLAEEYDVWRIEGDPSAIASAGRGASAPVFAVNGCADPSPTSATECTDTGAVRIGQLHYYQVRGVCGGTEGAL